MRRTRGGGRSRRRRQRSEEDLREGGPVAAKGGLELGEGARIHGEVAFVDDDAEAAKDGADGAAILEGAADDVEGGLGG